MTGTSTNNFSDDGFWMMEVGSWKLEEKHISTENIRVAEMRAERQLRASEVALARSEALKEFLLLGGTEYYAQILSQILAHQVGKEKIKKFKMYLKVISCNV